MFIQIDEMNTRIWGISDLSVATAEDAVNAICKVKGAVNKVSDIWGSIGAVQNRLEHSINNMRNAGENLSDAESAIRDTDMVQAMMEYVKWNILTQSSQSMLAQANQLPQGVLQLLQ